MSKFNWTFLWYCAFEFSMGFCDLCSVCNWLVKDIFDIWFRGEVWRSLGVVLNILGRIPDSIFSLPSLLKHVKSYYYKKIQPNISLSPAKFSISIQLRHLLASSYIKNTVLLKLNGFKLNYGQHNWNDQSIINFPIHIMAIYCLITGFSQDKNGILWRIN